MLRALGVNCLGRAGDPVPSTASTRVSRIELRPMPAGGETPGKKSFPVRVLRPWHTLTREAVAPPSLEVSKAKLYRPWSPLIKQKVPLPVARSRCCTMSSSRAREKSWDSPVYPVAAHSIPRMDSKGNVRSGNKPDAKAASSGKLEKPNPGPATNADKKETPKEQPASATATKKAGSDAAIANNHSNLKPSTAATETQEASGQSPDSDHKGNSSEESPGSFFDNMKPLIIVGGVAVAALAVIVGVAFLARKK